MSENNQVVPVPLHTLPEATDAIQSFEDLGGHLTLFSPFREDPLQGRPHMMSQRETLFRERYPAFDAFFHTVANSDTSLFSAGLLFFISVSKHVAMTLL